MHRKTPNATRVFESTPKRPRRRTIQSTTYTNIDMQLDAEVPTRIVRQSDDGPDVYEDSRGSYQTEFNTEPDAEDHHCSDATEAGLRPR